MEYLNVLLKEQIMVKYRLDAYLKQIAIFVSLKLILPKIS
jgi:hypothetical protein